MATTPGRVVPRSAWLRSMRLPCHLRAALADEEVEIGALMRLHDMVDVELGVAAVVVAVRRLPRLAALRQLGVGHVELEGPLVDVQLDHFPVLHQPPSRPPTTVTG